MSAYTDLGFARVDHDREARTGLAEVVYAPGKDAEQCAAIVQALVDGPSAGPILLTRASPPLADRVLHAVPGGEYASEARLAAWRPARPRAGHVTVVAAGTADLPVADEAAATLRALGWTPERVTDVGIAGLHRLLAAVDDLRTADILVVVAGMEGALPSAVAGLVDAPVVAVPTSTGYGASLDGVTALLSMLAGCAPGVCVVGIDNGFGAACVAARILQRMRADAMRRDHGR